MDGWMDGWMDKWMDGWINGWMDGWMDGDTMDARARKAPERIIIKRYTIFQLQHRHQLQS